MPRYKKEDVKKALIDADGIVSNAAISLGCARSTVYEFINKHDDVKQVFDDINETTIDKVENKMMDLIDEGNSTLIIFYLKTKAKHRGYVERQEHTGKDGEPMEIKKTVKASDLSDDVLAQIIANRDKH